MYASALGDNAVERYAMFLVSLALSADVAERRLALTRAKDHGLDMERVAVATAERTIEKAFEVRSFLVRRITFSTSRTDPSTAERTTTLTYCTTTSGVGGRTVPSSINRVDDVLG